MYIYVSKLLLLKCLIFYIYNDYNVRGWKKFCYYIKQFYTHISYKYTYPFLALSISRF